VENCPPQGISPEDFFAISCSREPWSRESRLFLRIATGLGAKLADNFFQNSTGGVYDASPTLGLFFPKGPKLRVYFPES